MGQKRERKPASKSYDYGEFISESSDDESSELELDDRGYSDPHFDTAETLSDLFCKVL